MPLGAFSDLFSSLFCLVLRAFAHVLTIKRNYANRERTTAASLEVDDDDDDDEGGNSRGGSGGGRGFMKRLRRKAAQLAITVAVVGTCAALLKYLWTEM